MQLFFIRWLYSSHPLMSVMLFHNILRHTASKHFVHLSPLTFPLPAVELSVSHRHILHLESHFRKCFRSFAGKSSDLVNARNRPTRLSNRKRHLSHILRLPAQSTSLLLSRCNLFLRFFFEHKYTK